MAADKPGWIARVIGWWDNLGWVQRMRKVELDPPPKKLSWWAGWIASGAIVVGFLMLSAYYYGRDSAPARVVEVGVPGLSLVDLRAAQECRIDAAWKAKATELEKRMLACEASQSATDPRLPKTTLLEPASPPVTAEPLPPLKLMAKAKAKPKCTSLECQFEKAVGWGP